ncbi:MAG TPA: hypothetical protein VKC60_10825 [Opitutaceae bacterium]|nr:hypothetical protein [Opitutaceae bacterium]
MSIVLILFRATFDFRISFGGIAYMVLLVVGGAITWRGLLHRFGRGSERILGEAIRLLAVGAAALFVVSPFISNRLLGGTDARWYATMFTDFIEQERAGVFPIFVGQTEWAFNGGVHPFRSAPWHMYFGGLLDLATLRSLNTIALEHLTVVLTMLASGFGLYSSLVAIAPTRRWFAMAVALACVTSPAWLAPLYAADAYMTFMALPAVVLVLNAHIQIFQGSIVSGYMKLAAGLAWVWVCHPPIAMITTMLTVVLQGGWWIAGERSWKNWRWAAVSGLVFIALSRYYFVSMSEIRGSGSEDVLNLAARIIGFVSLVVGLVKCERKNLVACAVLISVSLISFWLSQKVLVTFTVIAAAIRICLEALRRRWPKLVSAQYRFELLCAILLLSAAAASLILGEDWIGKTPLVDMSITLASKLMLPSVMPLSSDGMQDGNFQLGWTLVLLSTAAIASGAANPAPGAKVLLVALVLVGFLVYPIPRFTKFIWGNIPEIIASVSSIAMSLRFMPVLAPLAAFTGFGIVTSSSDEHNWTSKVCLILVFCLLPWSLWEAGKFVRRGFSITQSNEATRSFYRRENRVISRYAYDLLKIPAYVSHSHMDYRLESRVLAETDLSVEIGPEELTEANEKSATVEHSSSVANPIGDSPGWFELSPRLSFEPEEDRLFRFEFPHPNFAGYWIISGTGTYREYILPCSGYPKSFGIGTANRHVVTFTNSSGEPQVLQGQLLRTGDAGSSSAAFEFANVFSSKIDTAKWPIQAVSLMPYKVALNLKRPGFLETCRCYLNGYQATVNGQPVKVLESPEHLVMFQVPAGESIAELTYVGTPRMIHALWFSAAAWAVVIVFLVVTICRGLTSACRY